jgi:hypothetical protein
MIRWASVPRVKAASKLLPKSRGQAPLEIILRCNGDFNMVMLPHSTVRYTQRSALSEWGTLNPRHFTALGAVCKRVKFRWSMLNWWCSYLR